MADEQTIEKQLDVYKRELAQELNQILKFWADFTPDQINGGFYGKIDNDNNIVADSPKGSVLNARILWTFSAAYNFNHNTSDLDLANRAYDYIVSHVIDNEYGGVYWLLDYKGQPLDTKKQVYAIAFTIYALSEFFIASGKTEAKEIAIELFYQIVEHAYDPVETGYFEAFTRDWKPIENLRLSAKDANEKKTMNTHLHVLEGFTTLYRIWPDKAVKSHIEILLNNFFDHFIDEEKGHLNLFFDETWNKKSDLVSYGHDIEAAWLLLEAAEVVHNEVMIKKTKELAIRMAEATIEGLDADGGLWYEFEPADDHLIREKHWWVQAEAMVGFYNAWQISNDERYLDISLSNWAFVKQHILDNVNGEWLWGIYEHGKLMASEDKVGMWKCPYHNSRACIEIIKRIG